MMTGWEKPFVFRVEDRDELDLEQQLYSYPVSKYFAEDFGYFMWGFVNEDKTIEYKPVFLSQYAEQGNLTEIARSLRNTNPKHFAAITSHYFNQLTNLCRELIDAKVYHPDIKLTNFLIHGNRLIISDRKTLINTENCKAHTLRSTLTYAPKEYVDCVTPYRTFNVKAYLTSINLPQYMAYQLGMALKEFLILTQQDDIAHDDFRDHSTTAADYFKNPDRSIVNLSALINELTREDAAKRMSISQMRELLHFRNHPTAVFYQEIEKLLPASALGIQKEVNEIQDLLKSKLKGLELVKKANLIFNKLNESDSPEPRLLYLAGQLASKCFKEGSYSYFSKLSDKIEYALLDKDWDLAPWYRKIAHVLSFGYFRVDRISTVDSINLDIDFKGEEFKTHFGQLEHIAHSEFSLLGKKQALNFETFIFNNLEKIRAEEDQKKDNEGDTKALPVVSSPAQDHLSNTPTPEALDSGTVVITESAPVVKADQEQAKKPSIKLPAKVELAKKDEKPELAANQNTFFTKANKRTIFKTYRTTMFRGDGTLPAPKPEKPKPSVKDIFEPVIELELPTHSPAL
ncbi:hypothetical protein [Legionella sp. km772]|uniref:hypothetical protein n=1 Tax=Legionella sp. km772 TaxID=2498111 RepID=UPI001315748F|nr:hypothetical protein [Legionella sp. km772]